MRCSWGIWVTPCFSLGKSKVDEVRRLSGVMKPRLGADRLAVAVDGVNSRGWAVLINLDLQELHQPKAGQISDIRYPFIGTRWTLHFSKSKSYICSSAHLLICSWTKKTPQSRKCRLMRD